MAKTQRAKSDTKSTALKTPSGFSNSDALQIATALNGLVADAFTLYLKTKNFHWHMSGPHFRDYHLLLDEQADQIFSSIDPLAERVRKIGQTTVKSIRHISELAQLGNNDEEFVSAGDMIGELIGDNRTMAEAMRACHSLCDDKDDVATASLLEVYIDETERRTWFLFETSRAADEMGH